MQDTCRNEPSEYMYDHKISLKFVCISDVTFDEFQLEFIPLDEDVLTLELPGFLKDYFLVNYCTLT